ncbi:MAG TPA: helicase-associated domain-containing protein [Roseiflexaceae bacterium]|nr:helicase-associated domain-containing protein [Roseiflexaceae bacterium]
MPRVSQSAVPVYPNIDAALYSLNVDDLKWYLAALPGSVPTRKPELVAALKQALLEPAELQFLWSRLTPVQQQVVSEVAHNLGGQYNAGLIEAKYPDAPSPKSPRGYGYSFYVIGGKKEVATPFDLFFYYNYELGRYIPADLAQLLREQVPPPPAVRLKSHAEPPAIPKLPKYGGQLPEVMVSETERAIFHDLGATLYLIQEGKAAVSPATRLPTLPTLRLLRQNLLLGDYFADTGYDRAEDAIRPLALIVLAQAAKWAQPSAAGNKLELTRAGQALLGAPLGAQHVREAWERWLKSDVLDELSRIRNIKGQQAKGTRLTKPADRRAQLAGALRTFPLERWVTMDELLRYMRASGRLPAIERGGGGSLGVGSYNTYYEEDLGFSAAKYWDVITGSYLRATLWEYVATLGLIEIAYTWPEETPHDFGNLYYLETDYLSRYDGLLAMRLTNLGAYVLGLTGEYTPPALIGESDAPMLKVLPNLDIVITDATRFAPNERALLERVAAPQSQDVYRLSREQLLEAANSGLDLPQVKQFLAARSGQAEADFPQIVRVFFEDLEKRLGALRDIGAMLVLESDDPFLLTELSNNPALRAQVQLGAIGERTVLLIPEAHEAAVRKQLRKLGYIPRKA